jgi:hypothetical protein
MSASPKRPVATAEPEPEDEKPDITTAGTTTPRRHTAIKRKSSSANASPSPSKKTKGGHDDQEKRTGLWTDEEDYQLLVTQAASP